MQLTGKWIKMIIAIYSLEGTVLEHLDNIKYWIILNICTCTLVCQSLKIWNGTIDLDKSGYQVNSFLISRRKHILWVIIRSRGASNEYPHHMFLSRNKKNIDTFWLEKAPYQELWVHSKANRTLGFLRRKPHNLFLCPQDVKEMAILEYAIPVWTHME